MKINGRPTPLRTAEGGVAKHINAEQQLRRTLLSCMLWESTFYEDGVTVANRISEYAAKVDTGTLINLAVEARTKNNLRHAPLLILIELIRRGGNGVAQAIRDTIQRADEITELLALYWFHGKRPLSAQLKLGLGMAFKKFNEYQLAKYNRDSKIKLRDVLKLVHPKADNETQANMWGRLIKDELENPDTWESRLAGGEDKKTVFTDLLNKKKLGSLALLRNLRGMNEAGVNHELIKTGIEFTDHSRTLPFRFIAAARHAPMFEPQLDKAMVIAADKLPKIPGRTIILVDGSGSMANQLSAKSDLNRLDAACGLAILLASTCESLRVFRFTNDVREIPARKGMALRDAIGRANGGTLIGKAVRHADAIGYDRLIVITDEESQDAVPNPVGQGYMINVSTGKNGVGYGAWVHIDGFSEACVDFIREYEKQQ
jgi:hypothetical protein